MIAIVTLTVLVLAVVTAVATIVAHVLVDRRARGVGNRSIRELGVVSQQWLHGHRSETR